MRDIVSLLVNHVAARLSPDELNRSPDSGMRASVDHLIREAWGVHQHGTSAAIDTDRVFRAARAELLDLGPLADLVRDPQVIEVGVSRFDRISVMRGSQKTIEAGFSSETALRWAIQRLCESSGAPLSANEFALERALPDGMRLEAVIGASGNAVAILRRPRSVATSLEELVRRGTISRAIATLLQQCVTARLNVLVVGARDGGCEQLQSALSLGSSEGRPSGSRARWRLRAHRWRGSTPSSAGRS